MVILKDGDTGAKVQLLILKDSKKHDAVMKSIKLRLVSKIVSSLSTGKNDWEGQDNGEETSDQCSGGGLPAAETTGLLKTVSGCINHWKVSHQKFLVYLL